MIYHSMSAPRWRCAEVLVLLCFSGCFVGPTAPMDAAVPIIVHPTRDQYVPYNSIKNVTFSCAVESGRSAIWKVLGTQVRLQQQRETFASSGVFIYGESNNSIISVSFEARRVFRNLSLLCLSDQGLISTEGMTYSVVSFGAAIGARDGIIIGSSTGGVLGFVILIALIIICICIFMWWRSKRKLSPNHAYDFNVDNIVANKSSPSPTSGQESKENESSDIRGPDQKELVKMEPMKHAHGPPSSLTTPQENQESKESESSGDIRGPPSPDQLTQEPGGMEDLGATRGGPPPFPSSGPAPSNPAESGGETKVSPQPSKEKRVQFDSGDVSPQLPKVKPVQVHSGGEVSPPRRFERVEYDTTWSDKDDVVISIKLKELVQSIIRSENKPKYSRLKVKFE